MALLDILFGRPLASSEDLSERIGPWAGVPLLGLDALSSAAYGPEAGLTLLIPLGLAGVHFIVPIFSAIVVLLLILFFSYRQTIDAYPMGGGSYTVATENLGDGAGLLAGAALMTDYVLTAAVGISAGVGALVSAAPSLQPHILGLCLLILAVIFVVNMRGLRQSGVAFMLPTYLFVGCMLAVILLAIFPVVTGGHPRFVVAPPRLPPATAAVSLWLLLKAFASGCTAMTGVEAVSNGVQAFRDPGRPNAKRTLTIIILILIALLAGIAWACKAYGIGATDPDGPGYQSVLSQLTAAVAGRGIFYYVSIGSILLVLAFSANTAFADFPRLTGIIASHDFLPHVLVSRGRRLLHSWGIYALTALTALLLILFGGVTDRLIPLYAIGAFLAFTLSQAGMVAHWARERGPAWRWKLLMNGVGAVATGSTLLVVLVAKFAAGAWVTTLVVPGMIAFMALVRRHYRRVRLETAEDKPLRLEGLSEPFVIMPLDRWSRITERGLRFAMTLSKQVQVVHVDGDEDEGAFEESWRRNVAEPVSAAGLPVPALVHLRSPYRYLIQPLVDHVLRVSGEMGERYIAVVVPELVVHNWWQALLHNQRAQLLKLMLLMKGNGRIVVLNIPWYLDRPV